MSWKPWALVPALALAVLLAIGWNQRRQIAGPGAPEWLAVVVERGDVVRKVIASGTLNPVRSVQVGSQISGVILELPADFNHRVRQGDVVARLDPATFEANVRLAEAELASARAAAELARFKAERQRTLAGGALVSESDLIGAEVALRQAEATVRIREEHLERARLELARCTIVSPTDGIVISRNVDVGQTVAASLSAPVLFEIAEDLTRMTINARIPEAEIGRIAPGQEVEFRVDAFRHQRRHGRVIEVRRAPIMESNVVTYDTLIAVDNPDEALFPGMTAEVAIVIDARQDVLRVRNTALRTLLPEGWAVPGDDTPPPEGQRRIYRLRDPADPGSLAAGAIAIGLVDELYTEIVSGAAEGDRLVTGVAPQQRRTGSGRSSIFGSAPARY
jgi:HlyD family secretion protein